MPKNSNSRNTIMKTYNCIIVDDEPTAREILVSHIEKIDTIHIIGVCKNAIEAFAILNKNTIDLIFLDINMPEITGLSFAKTIRKDVKVIFTTAYREYAVDGFDLQAVDYLLKPISMNRLIQAIHKFIGESVMSTDSDSSVLKKEASDFFFIRSDRKMIRINFMDVLYIESLQDYIKIYTEKQVFVTRETISNIEARLPKRDFLRVHRSFIIAISKIESFTNEYIEINRHSITISRSYRKHVLHRLENI